MSARRPDNFLFSLLVALLILLAMRSVGSAATARTENFVVQAVDQVTAEGIAQACEHYRAELAQKWGGKLLAPWDSPAIIQIRVDRSDGGGATTFWTHAGRVTRLEGKWQGTRQKLINNVVPHEVLHTVLATLVPTHKVPLWLHEGIAVTAESPAERSRSRSRVIASLLTQPTRGLTMRELMGVKEHPLRPDKVRQFYDQSHSLVEFLMERAGRQKVIAWISEGVRTDGSLGAWQATLTRHYGFRDVLDFQNQWLAWLRQGAKTTRCVGLRRLVWAWQNRSARGPAHWHRQQCPT